MGLVAIAPPPSAVVTALALEVPIAPPPKIKLATNTLRTNFLFMIYLSLVLSDEIEQF